MKPSISVGKFEFTPTSIVISDQPGVEQWATPLRFALWCQRASPWWIGDLLCQGDARFGEMFSQVCEGEVSAEMLQRYESVARRVPPENRRDGLSWSAHAAVARLACDDQQTMLARAEASGWNSDQLRKQVRRFLAEKK